ncbi:GPW/gp25 family protein [Nitrococcus mobilis]|uniref:Phage baseplate assembly protein W n=1 Tax=Nitrococcus mobilis Nb-231 TaxID=314278 RepID=A4BR07_9GAMM|nr:GPW/gp25 family protein [Nitrococcus mobilis]EAR22007.1 Phage baseplate assembly protein W [Nitrococcus mobilis Nb-231]
MTTRLAVRLLGRGPSLPLMPDPRSSRLVYAEGPEKVRQAILIILETEPGERLMRPAFGAGLRRYFMKPNTTATRALMQSDVQRALRLWEPRIKLQEVRVEPGSDSALVEIQITYVHVRDGSPGSLVYPFYLE